MFSGVDGKLINVGAEAIIAISTLMRRYFVLGFMVVISEYVRVGFFDCLL